MPHGRDGVTDRASRGEVSHRHTRFVSPDRREERWPTLLEPWRKGGETSSCPHNRQHGKRQFRMDLIVEAQSLGRRADGVEFGDRGRCPQRSRALALQQDQTAIRAGRQEVRASPSPPRRAPSRIHVGNPQGLRDQPRGMGVTIGQVSGVPLQARLDRMMGTRRPQKRHLRHVPPGPTPVRPAHRHQVLNRQSGCIRRA